MKLKAALLQTDPSWGNKEKNLADAEEMICKLNDTDIAILPEMFSTGFMPGDIREAETLDGPTVRWMRRLAMEKGIAVAGSVIIRDGAPQPFNRFVFASPEGNVKFYDKRHLFSFSGEDKFYTAGEQRMVWEYNGFRILPMICYDLRFPVWSRNRNDYDVAIYIASWPQSRIGVWDTLLRARAIENQCYVLGINRVGNDPSAAYCGHTVAVDYLGKIIASIPEHSVGSIRVELDKDALDDFRNTFRVWADSDDFRMYTNP